MDVDYTLTNLNDLLERSRGWAIKRIEQIVSAPARFRPAWMKGDLQDADLNQGNPVDGEHHCRPRPRSSR